MEQAVNAGGRVDAQAASASDVWEGMLTAIRATSEECKIAAVGGEEPAVTVGFVKNHMDPYLFPEKREVYVC